MNTCQYNLRGNVPCGAPATHRNWTGARWMILCADHAHQVWHNTKGKSNPTPLPGAVVDEKSTAPLPALKSEISNPGLPPAASGLSPGQREQLRRFREQLAAQPDSGTL